MLGRPRRQPPRHTALPQISHSPSFIPPFQFGLGPAENYPGKRRKYARSNKVGQLHNLEGTRLQQVSRPESLRPSRLFDRVAFRHSPTKIAPTFFERTRYRVRGEAR